MPRHLPLVLSTAALAVALLGATPIGEAAQQLVIPRNSVGRAQLKNNAVTTLKVQNRTLKLLDFAPAERFKLTGPQGPTGPKGDKGDRGDKGETGAPGVSGYQIVLEQTALTNTNTKTAVAVCPSGKKVIGGGAFINVGTASLDDLALVQSWPQLDNSWVAQAVEVVATAGTWRVTARAICANVTT